MSSSAVKPLRHASTTQADKPGNGVQFGFDRGASLVDIGCGPSVAEMRDGRTGLPNHRALRVNCGGLFKWLSGMPADKTPGGVTAMVFDLIGGTAAARDTNPQAGFDLVCFTIQALAAAANSLGVKNNSDAEQGISCKANTELQTALRSSCVYQIGNDQLCLVVSHAEDSTGFMANLARELPQVFVQEAAALSAEIGIERLVGRLPYADAHIGCRAASVTIPMATLMRLSDGSSPKVPADKVAQLTAGLRAEQWLLAAKTQCVLGVGVSATPATGYRSTAIPLPMVGLDAPSVVGSAAFALWGDFDRALGRSQTMRAIDARNQAQDSGLTGLDSVGLI